MALASAYSAAAAPCARVPTGPSALELVTRSCCNVLVGRDRCEVLAVRHGVSTRPWIVDDDLWALIEPLLLPWPEKAPGLRPVPDRFCLQGILYVLHNDIAWQLLPLELGFGSGRICWRRLDRWQRAGVFDQLHRVLLAKLNAAGELDWSRACVDGSHIRAKEGVPAPVRHRSTGGRPAASTT